MTQNQIFRGCTIAQYRAKYASAELYDQLMKCHKISYAACVVAAVLSTIFGVMEILICLVLLAVSKVGVGKFRRRGCALAMALAGVVMVSLMMFSGVLWVISGAAMLHVFKKIDAEYRELMSNLRV